MASTLARVFASLFALTASLPSTPGSGKLVAAGGHGNSEAFGAADADADIVLLQGRADDAATIDNAAQPDDAAPSADDDCLQTTALLYGAEAHREQYAWVCCDNQHMAEHSGFQDTVHFWEQLAADPRASNGGEFTFYDAQCGTPLYVAPRGRSFAAWRDESHHHGWPSFRDAERVNANLLERDNGEIVSTCGTHLGHNIPDSASRDCINLICIAGTSSSNSTALTQRGPSERGTRIRAGQVSRVGLGT